MRRKVKETEATVVGQNRRKRGVGFGSAVQESRERVRMDYDGVMGWWGKAEKANHQRISELSLSPPKFQSSIQQKNLHQKHKRKKSLTSD